MLVMYYEAPGDVEDRFFGFRRNSYSENENWVGAWFSSEDDHGLANRYASSKLNDLSSFERLLRRHVVVTSVDASSSYFDSTRFG